MLENILATGPIEHEISSILATLTTRMYHEENVVWCRKVHIISSNVYGASCCYIIDIKVYIYRYVDISLVIIQQLGHFFVGCGRKTVLVGGHACLEEHNRNLVGPTAPQALRSGLLLGLGYASNPLRGTLWGEYICYVLIFGITTWSLGYIKVVFLEYLSN